MTKQYKKPEDMIDYNAELDTINGLMSIFFAYNQQQHLRIDELIVIIDEFLNPNKDEDDEEEKIFFDFSGGNDTTTTSEEETFDITVGLSDEEEETFDLTGGLSDEEEETFDLTVGLSDEKKDLIKKGLSDIKEARKYGFPLKVWQDTPEEVKDRFRNPLKDD